MIRVNKRLLSGTPDGIREMVEYLADGEDHVEYLAGTWLRELAVTLAECDGLAVSAVSYDDMAGYELEVTLVSAPHHDPIVIGRSRAGDRCQITLERWLPISGEPGIENAVKTIYAILAASGWSDPARINGNAGGPIILTPDGIRLVHIHVSRNALIFRDGVSSFCNKIFISKSFRVGFRHTRHIVPPS